MRLIIVGAPGAGKGTQAKILSKNLNVPHISTGDIFRENMKNDTELGIQIKSTIDQGLLVPDELTNKVVENRLTEDDCKKGFILDGFPRTVSQAKFLDDMLRNNGKEIDAVLDIEIPDEEAVNRISGRRVCKMCGENYHIISKPPIKQGKCDKCKGNIEQRDDDSEEIVKERLKIYHAQTEPVIAHYKNQEKLVIVRGRERIKDTTADVMDALGVNK